MIFLGFNLILDMIPNFEERIHIANLKQMSVNRFSVSLTEVLRKPYQTDTIMAAHAMREKPLCNTCPIVEISQVSVNKKA